MSDSEIPVIALPSREEADEAEEAQILTDLDFSIEQVVPFTSVEPGPGPHGRQVPYFKWGWAAICSPLHGGILSPDGKKKVVVVPLPNTGIIKISDLKRRANQLWREGKLPPAQ